MTLWRKPRVALGICLMLLLVPHSTPYPSGAPESPTVCANMNPQEGHGVPPETSEFPYSVTLSKTEIKGGDLSRITLSSSNGMKFKGFIIQVRLENKQKGTFSNMPQKGGEAQAKLMNCGERGNSVTHADDDKKTEVTFDWQAPNEPGTYDVIATVAEDGGKYWVAQKVGKITVTKSENFVRETTEQTVTISPEAAKVVAEMYEGCGDTRANIPKGCFGLPGTCVASKSCDSLVTFRSDGENGVRIEMLGKAQSYVAMGLSDDQLMGDDVVFGCRKDGNRIVVNEYYNQGKSGSQGMPRNPSLFNREEGAEIDGMITCKFNLKGNAETSVPTLYRFEDGKYFLIMSRGDNAGPNFLGKHAEDAKGAAPARAALTDIVVLGERSPILLQLHGSFMIMAWLLFGSVGMFTARYYKNTLTTVNPCGTAFWFSVHRPLMVVTLVLTISAIVIIFVEVQDLTLNSTGPDSPEHYHTILGLTVTALIIAQVLIALVRPTPQKKFRFLFNWFHWLFGNSAYIIGIACLFLANNMDKTRLKGRDDYMGVLVAFIAVHIIIHIIMSFHTFKADKHMEIRNNKRAVLPGPMKISESDSEAPGTAFRMVLLTIYFIAAGAAASALVYFVAKSFEP